MAHAAGLTKNRAEVIVETLFGSIAGALRQGEKVELCCFGSFRLRRPPRGCRRARSAPRVLQTPVDKRQAPPVTQNLRQGLA